MLGSPAEAVDPPPSPCVAAIPVLFSVAPGRKGLAPVSRRSRETPLASAEPKPDDWQPRLDAAMGSRLPAGEAGLAVRFFNFVYFWLDFPLIAGVGLVMYFKRRPHYTFARDAILLSSFDGSLGSVTGGSLIRKTSVLPLRSTPL